MDRDVERMIEATGLAMPLAGRIVGLVLDSGASQVEVLTALDLVRTVLTLLPAELVAANVGPPSIHRSS